MNGCKWYVVLTKPKQELRARDHLIQQDADVFLPEICTEIVRNGRRSKLQQPLFPGYLFISCAENDPLLSKIRSTRGVRGLLRFGTDIITVQSALIDDLKRRCQALADGETLFKEGQAVKIQSGPFREYDAIFHQYDGEKRAIVFLSILNQQQKLVLDLQDLNVA